MAAAAILTFEKLLPFLHFWTNAHQIWWDYGKFNLECNHYLKNAFIKLQCGGDRHLEFRKVVAISIIFDQCAPNSVAMLRIWYGTHCIVEKCKLTRSQDGGCRHLRLRLPPSWIAKNVCNFFTNWPILIKLGGDGANLMLNANVESEMSSRI